MMESSNSPEERFRFSKSITLQVILPMALIGLMALSSMLVTIFMTLYSEHDAEAINVAGSMRMQSYRIAGLMMSTDDWLDTNNLNYVEKMQFEHEQLMEKLYQSSITQVVERSDEEPINRAYAQVKASWNRHISPLLLASIKHPERRAEDAENYRQEVDGFVDDIDQLVFQIQHNAEDKNELMGVFGGLSVFLFFMLMSYTIMRVDQNLVKPLKALVLASKRISTGDFSHRVLYKGQDEIGLLSNVFNDMSDNLANYYRQLEEQVQEKTANLQQSNQVLDCLYHTAQGLSQQPVSRQAFVDILTDLKKTAGFEVVSLCLASDANAQKYDLILPDNRKTPCLINDCVNCDRYKRNGQVSGNCYEYSFKIGDEGNVFGFMYLKVPITRQLESWQKRLVEAVVDHISTALTIQDRDSQSRRLILFEERSIIARELHDSLAQSLSYMRMQVSRLSKLFERGATSDSLTEGLDDLQEGLASAYKHLRELLDTFRLQLNAPTLLKALEATVDEFGKRHQNIQLKFELGHCPLTPNEDVHILQIVREALSNAVKHADAENIWINCYQNESGAAVFKVADDGVGMADAPTKEHRYGLLTMQERASILAGEVILEDGEQGGTEVTLSFFPKHSLQTKGSVTMPL